MGEHTLDQICAQSKRMTTLFAGGLGGSHEELCGALAGAIMVMSALYGRTDCRVDDTEARSLARQYRDLFLAEMGYTCCGPLRERANGPQGTGSCRPLVERAAMLLLELLDVPERQMPETPERSTQGEQE